MHHVLNKTSFQDSTWNNSNATVVSWTDSNPPSSSNQAQFKITLKWSKNTTTGFQTRELINSTLVTNLTNKEVGIINYRVNISGVPE